MENGFGNYSLLNEFVRGLFSFRLKSVQIPKFLKTNKQKSHMNSLTQFQESTSNLHVCLQVVLSGYFVSSSILILVRPIFLAQECTEC